MVLAWVALMNCILTYTVDWDVHYGEHTHWDKDVYRGIMTKVGHMGLEWAVHGFMAVNVLHSNLDLHNRLVAADCYAMVLLLYGLTGHRPSRVPHLSFSTNLTLSGRRTNVYASSCSILLLILGLRERSIHACIPCVVSFLQAMAAGCPVLFLVGAGICWGHLVYAWRSALKFKELPPGVKPRTIHRFMEDFDVEVASRIGRIWDDEGVLDPTALELAENVLRVG